MRRGLLTLAILSLFALPAYAADPTGEWRVEDGQANIEIGVCGGRLWGIVSWERTPGTDHKNPDPALRNRPTLGLPILRGMMPVKADRWEGEVYDADNGRTYQARILLKRPDLLEIEGCVMSGWVCSSENWTRVGQTPGAAAAEPSGNDLCLRLGLAARLPNQRGLK